MKWNDKAHLYNLLNEENYAEAVEFIKDNYTDKYIDPQGMEIFLSGFDLTEYHLLLPIKDIILSYDSKKLNMQDYYTIEILKEKLKRL